MENKEIFSHRVLRFAKLNKYTRVKILLRKICLVLSVLIFLTFYKQNLLILELSGS